MSLLNLSIPGVLAPEKFELVAAKGVGSHRVVYQRVDTCPNGTSGCQICKYPGSRPGRHPRPIEQVDVELPRQLRGAFGRKTSLLPNRWRTAPVVLTVDGADFAEGEGYHIVGREIYWHDDAPVKDQKRYGVRYRAYREDWINVQHAYIDFAGGPRQAESSKNLDWGQVDQGMIAVTVQQTAAGYRATQDDRFIPVDALMDCDTQVDTALKDTHSRHLFVSEITRAFGLDDSQTREIEVPNVTFDQRRGRFVLPGAKLPPQVTLNYRATPIYTVYLDQGEFRHQNGANHGRLFVLQREEINR